MDRLEALDMIKEVWRDPDSTLGQKINSISEAYYSTGLDLATTAAYIKATPAELEALLELSEFDEDVIDMISKADPPKTTWSVLSSASEEEVIQALKALESESKTAQQKDSHFTMSEFVYNTMVEVSGPSQEQRIGNLSGDDIKHILKKGEDFNALDAWQTKFVKSIAAQKKRGKVLSDKQCVQLIRIIDGLVSKGAITRNSIDGDQEICDRILDALGK